MAHEHSVQQVFDVGSQTSDFFSGLAWRRRGLRPRFGTGTLASHAETHPTRNYCERVGAPLGAWQVSLM